MPVTIISLQTVHAEFSSTPSKIYYTDAKVQSIVESSTTIFASGLFNYVGTNYSPYSVLLDTESGIASSSFPLFNGGIGRAINDGSGGRYICGSFTTVGSYSRNYLAHILSDNSLDANFNPTFSGSLSTCSLALSSNRSVLYVGSNFTTVNGVARTRIAALNTSDGSLVSTFNPTISGGTNASAYINAMVLSSDDSRLYIGGGFTTINAVTYNRVAALNTSNGTASSTFNPNVAYTGGTPIVRSLALSSDGARLYIAGTFKTVAGVTYNGVAAINTSNGTASSTFNPNISLTPTLTVVVALSSDNSKLYLGGNFTSVGGLGYSKLAAVNTSDGSVITSFHPILSPNLGANYPVNSIALSTDNATLYVGGQFLGVNGQPAIRFAAIRTNDGSLSSPLGIYFDSTVSNISLSQDGHNLLASGSFRSSYGAARTGLVAINKNNGSISSTFIASTSQNFDVFTLVISPDGSRLYIGGRFGSINGVPRSDLGAVYISDGSIVSEFAPNIYRVNLNERIYATTISSDGSILYFGGDFDTVNGIVCPALAAVNTSDGSVVSSFYSGIASTTNNSIVDALALSRDNSKLYTGGVFRSLVDGDIHIVSLVDAATGVASSTYYAYASTTINGTVTSLTTSSDESKLYVGGGFTSAGGVTHNHLAALNADDGSVISTFNASSSSSVDFISLSPDESRVYVNGTFSERSNPSSYIASLNTIDGTVSPTFSPSTNGPSSILVSHVDPKIYLGNSDGLYVYDQANLSLSKSTMNVTVGSNDTYTIALIAAPSADVVVTLTPDVQTSISTTSIRFTSSNYSTPQVVTVSAQAGQLIPGQHGSITHTASSSDISYNGISMPSVSVIFLSLSVATTTTSDASSVSTSTLTLNGNISDDGGASTTIRGFAYGTVADLSIVIATTTELGTFGVGAFTKDLSGLTLNTRYYFRAYTANSVGTSTGDILSTTTLAISVPGVATQAVSGTAATTTMANGSVTSTGNLAVNSRGFVYGTSVSYGATTTPEAGYFNIGTFTATIAGLTCNTLYHVAAFAVNSQGISYGNDMTFTSGPCIPVLTSSLTTFVSTSTLTLNGNISDDGGASTTLRGFAYGTVADLSTVIATTTEAGTFGVGVFTKDLTGLTPNTLYFFRAYAVNSVGTSTGVILSTTTIAIVVPTISASTTSGVTASGATLNASIDSLGGDTYVSKRGFEYGSTATYGSIISTSGIYRVSSFSTNPTNLNCGTTYHFRSFAKNSIGTASSTDTTFITDACPIVSVPTTSGGSSSSGGQMYRLVRQPDGSYLPATTVTPGTGIVREIAQAILPDIFGPDTPSQEIEPLPLPATTTGSLSLGEAWNLLNPLIAHNFTLAPLPSQLVTLVHDFPKLEKVFNKLGVKTVADLDKLRGTAITLPTIADLRELPPEVVVAEDASGKIGVNSSITVLDSGSVQQQIQITADTDLKLAVRPSFPAETIIGYLVFRKSVEKTVVELPLWSQAAAAVLATENTTNTKATIPSRDLLVSTFTYTDHDQSGIYTASIHAPVVEGTYEVITLITYRDKSLGTKELRLTTVVDPEGYVYYKNANGDQSRISRATVSIFDANTGVLWDAESYNQTNPQKTDVSGKYSFLVPEGKYYLTAEAQGYNAYRSDMFDVRAGNGVHSDIELTSKFVVLNIFDWKMILIVILFIALIINFVNDLRYRKKGR